MFALPHLRFNDAMEARIYLSHSTSVPKGPSGFVSHRTAERPTMKAGAPPTISIIDDDEAVRSALRMLVLSFGWTPKVYASGQSFLDALPQAEPDCILLDLDMPGMNGAEVQESLHARGVEIPVIIITGQKNTQLLSRARAAGACDMLAKPFQDEELKLSIERAIEGVH